MAKKLLKFCLAFTALFAMASCEKQTILNCDQSALQFTSDGESKAITFETNKAWNITSSESWCKVSSSSGVGEEGTKTSVTVTCIENTDYDDRSCTITVTAEELTKTINISQKQANGLLISTNKYDLSNEAQTINIEVKSNVNFKYTVDQSCQDWLHIEDTKGLTASSIQINVDKNATYDSREGKIIFEQTDGSLKETVTVRQGESYALLVSPTSYILSNDTQTIDVEVKANVDYEYTIDESCTDWIKATSTKGLTTKTISFEISANNSYDDREGKIYFKQKNGSLYETVTISQGISPTLLVSTSEYELSNEVHTITIDVKSNIQYNVQSTADWIEVIETKSLTTSQITLKVHANDTFDQRQGEVKVTQTNGSLSETITIRQAEKSGFVLSKNEFQLSSEGQKIKFEVNYNVDYEIIIPEDATGWVSELKTKGFSSKEHTYWIAQNKGLSRSTTLTIKQIDGPLCEDILICQSNDEYNVSVIRTVSSASTYLDKTAAALGKNFGDILTYDLSTIKAAIDFVAPIASETVRIYTVNYPSKDPQGNDIMLSAALYIPDEAITEENRIKGVVLANEYTNYQASECPTKSYNPFGLLSWMNYAVLIPDGLGFGASEDYYQDPVNPFMTGRSNSDAMTVALKILKDQGVKVQSKDWINIGYSQGANSAIATEKFLSEHPEYDLTIAQTIVGGGAYDLNVTFDWFVESNNGSLLRLLINSLIGINENENLGIDYSELFKGELLEHYREWFFDKALGAGALENLFESHELSEYINAELLAKQGSIWEKFESVVTDFGLTNGWTPRSTSNIIICHSAEDNYVPFKNYELMKEAFGDCTNFTFVSPGEGNHFKGILDWAMNGLNEYWLKLPISF